MWWNQRRPEIVEDFDREVLGRVPEERPQSHLGGHEDRRSQPRRPRRHRQAARRPRRQLRRSRHQGRYSDDARGPRQRQRPGARDDHVRRPQHPRGRIPCAHISRPRRCRAVDPLPTPPANADPPATEQLIADGWGFASLNPTSIQADNGAGLTKGIIGLVNKGQPRKPDDWGALRAWAWGASRGSRLSRNRQGRQRQAGRHRRRLALRQSRSRHHGLRYALRRRAGRLLR